MRENRGGMEVSDIAYIFPLNTKTDRPAKGSPFRLRSSLGVLAGDQAHLFKLQDHLMCAVVDVYIFRLDTQFRICRYIIRI